MVAQIQPKNYKPGPHPFQLSAKGGCVALVGIENVNGVRSVLGRARTMAQLRNAIIKQMMSTATDAELIALGERFEKLLLEYVDAWLAWAPLMRAARAEAEADIATLTAAIQRNGCDVAQARMSELKRDMQPLAEEIIAAPATSLGGLRAKALVAFWEALPAHAFHHGAFRISGRRRRLTVAVRCGRRDDRPDAAGARARGEARG
jgi:hypothetical protein